MNKNRIFLGISTFFVIFAFLGQRIVINLYSFEWPISLFMLFIFFFFLILYRKVSINNQRLLIYIIMLLISFVFTMLSSNFKLTSYVYFLIIYLFFIFDYKFTDYEKRLLKKTVINVLFVTAIVGIFQFLYQILGKQYIDIFDFFPSSFIMSGFNSYYPLWYGSDIMKSNGWIYLEPSFFSQFMCFGLIIHLNKRIKKNDIIKIITFSLALALSFSGTGILLLIIAILPLFLGMNNKYRFYSLLLGGLGIIVFFNTNYSYSIVSRLTEIANPSSSASIRFINPFLFVFKDNNRLFFGNGAGMVDLSVNTGIYNFSAVPKVIYEYGLLVFIFYIILIFLYFFRNKINLISFECLVMYLFLAGNLLQPNIIITIVIINLLFGNKRKINKFKEKNYYVYIIKLYEFDISG